MADRITIAQVDKHVQGLDAMVKDHDRILVRGNGEPSMQENVRTVQKDIEEIKKFLKEEKQTRAAYLKLIVGIVAGQLLAGIVTVAIYIVRVAPYIDEIIHHVK